MLSALSRRVESRFEILQALAEAEVRAILMQIRKELETLLTAEPQDTYKLALDTM